MSLSPEEQQALYAVAGYNPRYAEMDEAIWIAAKDYWLEQAAQMCDLAGNAAFGVPAIVEDTCDRLAARIRLLKDKHG